MRRAEAIFSALKSSPGPLNIVTGDCPPFINSMAIPPVVQITARFYSRTLTTLRLRIAS